MVVNDSGELSVLVGCMVVNCLELVRVVVVLGSVLGCLAV